MTTVLPDIRQAAEERELKHLAPYAAKSLDARREKAEEPCPFRTSFQRDRDRILHTKAFRRLAYKTQVFINPVGDHYRNRLTHTLEVSQIARTLAHALNLNEDLTEAIALGHDLGHTPFGHSGERVLARLLPGGFTHQSQSLRIVEVLAKEGGLNLTAEVRDGIFKHSKGRGPVFVRDGSGPVTLEGCLVRVSDIIAYLAHDLDDALRAGLLSHDDIPRNLADTFGPRGSTRIRAMVGDLLANSQPGGNHLELSFSRKMESEMEELREFLYLRVYQHPSLTESLNKADGIIESLWEKFITHPDCLWALIGSRPFSVEIAAGDFISGMTDRYAMTLHKDMFWPPSWR